MLRGALALLWFKVNQTIPPKRAPFVFINVPDALNMFGTGVTTVGLNSNQFRDESGSHLPETAIPLSKVQSNDSKFQLID